MAQAERQQQLCSQTEQITIENVTPPRYFPVHTSLAQLRECGGSCSMCNALCAELDLDSGRSTQLKHVHEHGEHLCSVQFTLDRRDLKSLHAGWWMVRASPKSWSTGLSVQTKTVRQPGKLAGSARSASILVALTPWVWRVHGCHAAPWHSFPGQTGVRALSVHAKN